MVAMVSGRAEIADRYRWDLSPIYPDDAAWEATLASIDPLLADLGSYAGRLGSGAQALFDALALHEKVSRLSERLWQYAARHRDEDMTSARAQALFDRALQLGTDVEEAGAFIRSEIAVLPKGTLDRFMDEVPALKIYAHYFETIMRDKAHLLPEGEERLLASAGDLAGAPPVIYKMLSDADIDFGSVIDEQGNEVAVTSGTNYVSLASPDRRVREETYQKMFGAFATHRNTCAAIFSANVKKDNFFADARKHPSALAAALHSDNIPVEVYDNLIETVRRSVSLLQRYLQLRRKALGLEDLRRYDLYVSLAPEPEREVQYDEAVSTVLEALAPLGEDYIDKLRAGLEARWVDVYETPNKRTGAHSGGAYDTYPYTMLNYQPKPIWRNTLAHELGHAMHTHYACRTQNYIYAYPSDFLGEIAATVNEQLLGHYLLGETSSPSERLALLTAELENMRHAIFRQTMLAEFEKKAHEAASAGEALTADSLSDLFAELVEQYHGPSLQTDDLGRIEWATIPHFYFPFYVYQYATAKAAAVALAKQILDEGEPAAKRYRWLLSSGSSRYTLDLLREAGVDMSRPEPIESALRVFEETLEEAEKVVALRGAV